MGRNILGDKMFLQNTKFSSCATLMHLISSFGTVFNRLCCFFNWRSRNCLLRWSKHLIWKIDGKATELWITNDDICLLFCLLFLHITWGYALLTNNMGRIIYSLIKFGITHMLSCSISVYALQQYYTLLFHRNVLLEDSNALCFKNTDNRIYFSIKCFLNGNNVAYSAVSGFDSQPIGTFSWATATRINGEVIHIKSNFKWEVTIHENTKKILISQFQEGKSM